MYYTKEEWMDIIRFNELLARVKIDESAFTELYSYYFHRIILHIERKYPGVPGKDIAHDFFLFLFKEKIPMFVSNPSSWVYTVCDNMARRYIRDNWDVEPDKLEPVSSLDLLKNAMETETIKEIFDLIENEEDRKIIYYIYWLGYNSNEISKILGINRATIRKRHSRIIKKLKKYLTDVTDIEKNVHSITEVHENEN